MPFVCGCREIQPLESRAIGTSFSVCSNMLFTFIIGQTFPHMLCKMQWGVFVFYAGCLAGMVTLVTLFAVETKGYPIEAVKTAFEEHWFWEKRMGPKRIHGGPGGYLDLSGHSGDSSRCRKN